MDSVPRDVTLPSLDIARAGAGVCEACSWIRPEQAQRTKKTKKAEPPRKWKLFCNTFNTTGIKHITDKES